MKPIDHLTKLPLLKGLPPGNLEALANILVEQTLEQGEPIFSEGAEATGFYTVIS